MKKTWLTALLTACMAVSLIGCGSGGNSNSSKESGQASATNAAGEKVKHWIWYIFPILRGLGKSEESAYFGLGGVDEAESYLADPVLGGRLRECTGIIIDLAPKPVSRILFGDEWKFVNCMTLFEHVSPQDLFTVGLDRCPPLSSNQTARILSRL